MVKLGTLSAISAKAKAKVEEIIVDKGDGLKVGGVGISRSFTFPDPEAPGEEILVSITVKRVETEKKISSIDVKVDSALVRELVKGVTAG